MQFGAVWRPWVLGGWLVPGGNSSWSLEGAGAGGPCLPLAELSGISSGSSFQAGFSGRGWMRAPLGPLQAWESRYVGRGDDCEQSKPSRGIVPRITCGSSAESSRMKLGTSRCHPVATTAQHIVLSMCNHLPCHSHTSILEMRRPPLMPLTKSPTQRGR